MEFEPERIEQFFSVRAFDPIRKRWHNVAGKYTRETAEKFFGDRPYEILEYTMEERQVGGNPYNMMGSHFKKPD